MRRVTWSRLQMGALLAALCLQNASAQRAFTWQDIRDKFEAQNPTLRAGEIGISESRTQEITAYLRPNPDLTATLDQIDPFTTNPYRPFTDTLPFGSVSYLHERQHKRELRLESAKKATEIAASSQADLERNLVFSLRHAFVQTPQAKSVLALSRENLAYYDRLLSVNRDRYKAGDIAEMDLDRIELQRVQFESDVQTAEVNLRTAKIQILMLLNERTPVETFDVTGPFDFGDKILALDESRAMALEARPDLKAAVEAVEKSGSDHRLALANGSTDPTFALDFARNPPVPVYFGVSVTIPLRIFDKNQGEKARTELDMKRSEKLRDATRAQVFSDVDSAYATLDSNLALLRPYKAKYLQTAVKVRDTVSFAYQYGGASLLDYLNAQNDYRSIQLNYLNLVGSYLTAASQLNLAMGREEIQ